MGSGPTQVICPLHATHCHPPSTLPPTLHFLSPLHATGPHCHSTCQPLHATQPLYTTCPWYMPPSTCHSPTDDPPPLSASHCPQSTQGRPCAPCLCPHATLTHPLPPQMHTNDSMNHQWPLCNHAMCIPVTYSGISTCHGPLPTHPNPF